MPTYSYARCLTNSHKINWRIEEVLGDRRFDPARRWLPLRLSGASFTKSLDEDARRKLTHVEMASYAHLFGYVEEFIAPKVTELSRDFEVDQREVFDALANFAAEEVKHMHLFRRLRDRVNGQLGFETQLLGDQATTARYVLSKSTGAVLLLTAAIEWRSTRGGGTASQKALWRAAASAASRSFLASSWRCFHFGCFTTAPPPTWPGATPSPR
jgi:hypothetical protein